MINRWFATIVVVALAAVSAPAGEVDRFLPADTEIVVTIKVKEILDAPVFKVQLLELARKAIKSLDEIEASFKDLGFDPFTDLDKVIIAGPGGMQADKAIVIAHGHFDLDKFKTKGEEEAKENPENLKILKVKVGTDERVIYEVNLPQADAPFYVSLASKNTLLASFNKEYILEALKNVDPRSKAQLRNKLLQTAVEQASARPTITMAAAGAALARFEVPEALRTAAGKLEAVAGGLTVGEDIRLDLVLQCASEQQAHEVARTINDSVTTGIVILGVLARKKEERYAPLVEVIKSVHANHKEKTATVTLKGEVSSDLLGKLLKGLPGNP